MFLPYFIALMLGLVSPSNQSNSNCHQSTQVSTTNDDPGQGGGTGDDDTDTGGETGQTPPPKID